MQMDVVVICSIGASLNCCIVVVWQRCWYSSFVDVVEVLLCHGTVCSCFVVASFPL